MGWLSFDFQLKMAFHSSSLSFLGVPRRLSLVSIETFREVLKHLNFCPSYGLKKPSPGPSPICIIFWKNVLIVLFRQNFFPFLLIRLRIWPVQSWFSIFLQKKRSVIAKHVVMVIRAVRDQASFPSSCCLTEVPSPFWPLDHMFWPRSTDSAEPGLMLFQEKLDLT